MRLNGVAFHSVIRYTEFNLEKQGQKRLVSGSPAFHSKSSPVKNPGPGFTLQSGLTPSKQCCYLSIKAIAIGFSQKIM